MRSLKSILLAAVALPFVVSAAQAAPATWSTSPADNNFNNSANWSAGGPPGVGEQGTFGASNTTVVQFVDVNTTTGGFTFNSGSPAYTVLVTNGRNLTIQGDGNFRLTTPSVTEQTITFSIDTLGGLTFSGGTMSGGPDPIVYANAGGLLRSGGTAGNATIQNGVTGNLNFSNALGGTANILNNGIFNVVNSTNLEDAIVRNNATMTFLGDANAGSSNILNFSSLTFDNDSSAGASTIQTAGLPGTFFIGNSTGGTSRQIVTSSGVLDISGSANGFVDFGSVEGDGSFVIGNVNTFVGGNNHDFVAPNARGERVVTFNGVISGAGGSVNKVGTGTWVLGGANTYGGGTAINGGVLQISADNNLGDAAGGLTFDGGTLRTTSTFSTGRTFTLDAGGGTIETNSTTELTITSAIGEAGGARALTKAGGGDLILTGASTYTGGTNIDAGRLILGNGGATGSISSTGGIAIASGAVLMFFRNDATTISNDISGEGTVHQRGIGTTTLSGTNTYSGVTDIQFGRLIAAGSGVGDSSDVFVDGPGVFEITSDETIGSLGGSGSVELNANTLTLGGGSANSVVFNGVITGAGGVVKDGAYTQTFNNNQDYQGSTTIDGGTLLVNGTLRDAVIVNSGATFGGNASIIENDNLFSNSGNVSPGNSPGTINVAGDYITSGAPTLTVDVFANQVNAPVNGTTHDFFSVGDDVIGVDTRILLDFSLNSGAPVATTGNGIEIVRVGDVSQTDDFFLSTAVQTGPQGLANGFIGGFQYLVNALQGSGPGGSDQFFLRTVVREELVANATILAAGRQVSRDCFRGPEHTQNGENKGKTRAWVNGRYGTFESDASNGADFDSDYTCVTGGVDTQVGDGFTLGLRGGYATQDVDLTVVQGVANLHGDTWTFEAALSYANNEGYYSGMTFGYRSTDWEYRHALASGGTSSADVDGVVGSLHAGYRNNLGGNATLGLEGAVLYDATDCDANCILAGTVEDTSDWEARIAARYDAVWGAVQPYALLSVSHNFGDGQTVSFGNAISEVDTASALLGLNLGLSADVGEGWALSAEVATTQGLDSEVAGYQGTLGLRKTW